MESLMRQGKVYKVLPQCELQCGSNTRLRSVDDVDDGDKRWSDRDYKECSSLYKA